MNVSLARKKIACIGIWALLSSVAHAQAPDAVQTLTLPQALTLAKERNPALAASAFEVLASDARRLQAEARLSPELALEFEDFAGSGEFKDANSLETTLSLSQAIEFGDKRQRRADVAIFGGEFAAIDQQARELDVLADVARRFVEVVAAQEQVALARSAAALAETTVNALTERVQAARSPQAELSRAQIAKTRVRIAVLEAEGALLSARQELAALWGATEPDFQIAQADLYALPPAISLAELHDRIARTPQITRFATEARLREAQWQLERAQAKPNLNLSIGVRHFEATSDTALVAGVSMPLPFGSRYRGAIEEARIRREQSTAEEHATRVRIQATVSALHRRVSSSRLQLEVLTNEAVPLARAALEQTQHGYERGRFSYLELAAAQQELLSLRSAVIDAAVEYHKLTTEIERLIGAAIVR
jgi:cobalt-zinc-cadmium efflux system outer membrane protein